MFPFLHGFQRGDMRRVTLVNPSVDEERFALARFNEGRRVRRRGMKVGGLPFRTAVEDGELVVAIRLRLRCALGQPTSQMPLAEVRRAIARLFEKARQRWRIRVQPVGHAALVILRRLREVLMHGIPRRIMPRHHSRATRRADGAEHIELLEVRALTSEPVQIWRLQKRMSVARQIPPPPVVGKNEDNVGFHFAVRLRRIGGGDRRQRCEKKDGEEGERCFQS